MDDTINRSAPARHFRRRLELKIDRDNATVRPSTSLMNPNLRTIFILAGFRSDRQGDSRYRHSDPVSGCIDLDATFTNTPLTTSSDSMRHLLEVFL